MKTTEVSVALHAFIVMLLGLAVVAPTTALCDASAIERGRYLVKIAGCNDCHTSGYLMSAGQVPETDWLTGDSFGWRGPWGTTYATNLRLRLQQFSQDEWLTFARGMKARPPMPWFTLNEMHEQDLIAIYQYIRHLGAAGAKAPAFLPPEIEPNPPYALFPPPPPGM